MHASSVHTSRDRVCAVIALPLHQGVLVTRSIYLPFILSATG